MNIALIIAGGSGARMNQDIPKQFLNVYDKPVIVYTMEAFQKHDEVDSICVVCLDGWHEMLKAYARQFGITKLDIVVSGGKNGQASIRNGIEAIEKCFDGDDLVLVHDAIRPMISSKIISENIEVCRKYGNAVTVIPCQEAMVESFDKISSHNSIPRDILFRTQTPQTFKLKDLIALHREADEKNITNSIASCTLMAELGHEIYFASGSEKNIKLTTTDDLEIFKALLKSKNESWIK